MPTSIPAATSDVAGTETPSKPDETPLDTEGSKAKLERRLSLRPDKKDLVEKNILKGEFEAP